MNWELQQQHFAEDAIADNGNRFLVGNGYLGVRGTLEESTREQLVAVNLAGIYHQVEGGWREPLNAPNPLYTYLIYNRAPLALPRCAAAQHSQSLHFRHGILRRSTTWQVGSAAVTLETERFASLAHPHLLCMRYTLRSSAEVDIALHAGIDADVWDIHGPHYGRVEFGQTGNTLHCTATVAGGGAAVACARKNFLGGTQPGITTEGKQTLHTYALRLPAETPVTLTSLCSVYTTRDDAAPAKAALHALETLGENSYEGLLSEHCAAWEAVWRTSLVEIEGDEEAERAVNYSLYQLNCAAPRQGGALSIPARGLSGQTYKGAVFWDSELFMLDYFLCCQPRIAESMVRYRISTLPGALQKAAAYGWQGAFYAWESQEGGFDACSDYNVTDVFTGRPVRTYFKDKQVHISAAVVWAVMHYVDATGHTALLTEGGARTVFECARFYWSLLVRPLPKTAYELHDVIGPDEYHERVNNNAYTNRMAAYCFESALKTAALLEQHAPAALAALQRELGLGSLLQNVRDALRHLYVPQPGPAGVIEQFDGYFGLEDASVGEVRSRLKDPREYWGGTGVAADTQVIKQADVVAMLELFHADYTADMLRANWHYYEPRTEHGSSLSACLYALLACRFGEASLAYPFFLKSATAEIRGGGKQWAGLVYIGGTHPAAAGGAWKALAQGFGGLHLQNGVPALTPCLPPHWRALRFRVVHGGKLYTMEARAGGAASVKVE